MKNLVSTPDFMSSLAIYLRFCRESRKLSQNELSSMINVGVRTYQRIESGETAPSVDLLHKISKVLKIDLSEIMVDQTREDFIIKFNFNILDANILFSSEENKLFNNFINLFKIQLDDSRELNLDSLAELDLFANNSLNLALSDPKWTYLNSSSRKFFHNEDEKLISCLNQKKQELGIMWASLIQNNIEAFTGNHTLTISEAHSEMKFISRNRFVKIDTKFFIFTILN